MTMDLTETGVAACEERRLKIIAALDCFKAHVRVNQVLAGYRVHRDEEVGASKCEGCVLRQYCVGIRRGLQDIIEW